MVYLILRDDPLRRFAPAPPKGEPLAWRESLRLNRKACGRACSPGGAVAQRLKGFKSAEPEKTVKRSSRRTGVNLQFFPVQPTSLGLKGASSPFFVAPARRNRCDLAVLNAQHLLRKPVCDLKAPLGLSCLAGTAALFFSFATKREHPSASNVISTPPSACSAAAAVLRSPPRSAVRPHNRRSGGRKAGSFRAVGCPPRSKPAA